MSFANTLMNFFYKLLDEIRDAETHIKTRWVYGAATFSLLLILGFWATTSTSIVPSIAQPEERIAQFARLQPKPEPGVDEVFVAGLSTILRGTGLRLSRGIELLSELIFGKPKTIDIVPPTLSKSR